VLYKNTAPSTPPAVTAVTTSISRKEKEINKETTLDTITTIISRYYEQDTWKSDLIFEQSSFDLLQNILKEAGELPAWTPYEDLVTTTFAAEASESAH